MIRRKIITKASSRAVIEAQRRFDRATASLEPGLARSVQEAVQRVLADRDLTPAKLAAMLDAGQFSEIEALVGVKFAEALSSGGMHRAAKYTMPQGVTVLTGRQAQNALTGASAGMSAEQLSRLADVLDDARTGASVAVAVRDGAVVGAVSWRRGETVAMGSLVSSRSGVGAGLVGEVIRRNPGMVVTGAGPASFFERMGATPTGDQWEFSTAPYQQSATQAVIGGASAAMSALPETARIRAQLNLTNPYAVRYLESTLPTRISGITQQTQVSVRETILRGFNEGRPTREMAKDIRRVVGLNSAQAQYVNNFRAQLESGEIRGMTPPDRRRLNAIDQKRAEAMRRAALEGRPAKQKQIDDMVDTYSASLVNRRAKDIARTETTSAFGAGQHALWDEAIDRGLINPTRTRRKWLVTPDDRLREQHAAVPGMNPDGVYMGQPYDTPIGPVMGPRMSGVAGFDINCRCTEYLEFDDV